MDGVQLLIIFGFGLAFIPAFIQWLRDSKNKIPYSTISFYSIVAGLLLTMGITFYQKWESNGLQRQLIKADSTIIGLQKEEIKSFKNSEYDAFLADFNEYQVLKGEYFNVAYPIYETSMQKTEFLKLTGNQIKKIEEDINQAITNIKKNKFVSINNKVSAAWGRLNMELHVYLYFFSFKIGDTFINNEIRRKIDYLYKRDEYNKLQEFLKQFGEELHHATEASLNKAQKN